MSGEATPALACSEPDSSGYRASRLQRLARFASYLAGPLLLVVLLCTVDLGQLGRLLGALPPWRACAAGAAFLGVLTARCERWYRLLRAGDLPVRRVDAYASCLRSIWLGLVTPGRVGEFKRGLDVSRRHGIGLFPASGLVAADLLCDFCLTAIVAAAAGLTALATGTPLLTFQHGVAISLAVVLGAGLLGRPAIVLTHRFIGRVRAFASVADMLARLRSGQVFVLSALTAVSNGFLVAMMLMLIDGIDPSVTIEAAIVITATAMLAGALPITLFGLGTREAALILLLTTAGRSREVALAISLSFLTAQAIAVILTVVADTGLRQMHRARALVRS